MKNEGVRMVAFLRRAILEAGRRLAQRGLLTHPEEIFFLQLEEVETALGGTPSIDIAKTVAARRALHERYQKLTPPPTIVGQYDEQTAVPSASADASTVLQGVAVSPVVVIGRARVILHADADAKVLPGDVLVAPYTDPGWTPYFLSAAAIAVDVGGLRSHRQRCDS